MSAQPTPIDLPSSFDALTFLPDRVPTLEPSTIKWADTVAEYRDGGIYVVHYAGSSPWERHSQGDEFVMVVEGATTMTLFIDGEDRSVPLTTSQFVVVPGGVWHRFDTPEAAKIMTITPQPTDHMLEHPSTLDSHPA